MALFDPALQVVLVHEGGLVDDPADPGGITDYGISLRFLKDHGIDIDGDGDVDADDIRGLQDADVARLYDQFFWRMVHGPDLDDQELASKLFDTAVNVGVPRAVRLVQEVVGADIDGSFGPQTFRLLQASHGLADALGARQAAFYRGLVDQRPASVKFLRGWLVRAACTLSHPCRLCQRQLTQMRFAA